MNTDDDDDDDGDCDYDFMKCDCGLRCHGDLCGVLYGWLVGMVGGGW